MSVQGTQYSLTSIDNVPGLQLRDESGNTYPVQAGAAESQASAGVPDATLPQLGTVKTLLVYGTTAGGAAPVVVPTPYAPPVGHASGLFAEVVARDNVANTANCARVIARTKNLGGLSVDGGTVTLDAGGGGAPMAAATLRPVLDRRGRPERHVHRLGRRQQRRVDGRRPHHRGLTRAGPVAASPSGRSRRCWRWASWSSVRGAPARELGPLEPLERRRARRRRRRSRRPGRRRRRPCRARGWRRRRPGACAAAARAWSSRRR